VSDESLQGEPGSIDDRRLFDSRIEPLRWIGIVSGTSRTYLGRKFIVRYKARRKANAVECIAGDRTLKYRSYILYSAVGSALLNARFWYRHSRGSIRG
jgi:hypothetical protein